jgi:hypothetical protein
MTLKPDVTQWLASLPGQTVLLKDKPVSFLGRNGVYGARGLYLLRLENSPFTGPLRLQIQPITSKGDLGRGWLEIPLADVPTLVAALQDFLTKDRAIVAIPYTITFTAQGYVKQTVELQPGVKLTPKQLENGLNSGRYGTTIQEDGTLEITRSGKILGTVVNVENQLEYAGFEVEGEVL